MGPLFAILYGYRTNGEVVDFFSVDESSHLSKFTIFWVSVMPRTLQLLNSSPAMLKSLYS